MFVTNINQIGKIEWDKDWHLEVEQCLEYKYTEQVLFETRKPLCIAELWAMGETYQMHELKEWVHNFWLQSQISLENVVKVLIDANNLEVQDLKDTCRTFIGENIEISKAHVERLPRSD